MHIQVVLLALAALASSQDPFGMELLVMEEIMCDLLRRHPVYRELSLKNVEECHYNHLAKICASGTLSILVAAFTGPASPYILSGLCCH